MFGIYPHLYYPLPLTVTTDVSHVTTSLHYPTLTITCHFLPGSPAHGCYVSLTSLSLSEPPGTSSLSVMVPRSNSSSQATTVVVLTQQPTCYRLEVYDWEGGREVGQIPIPLETTDLESGPSCEIGNGTTRGMLDGRCSNIIEEVMSFNALWECIAAFDYSHIST